MDEVEAFLTEVAREIKAERCVIFFGSGVSAGSGLPTGGELMAELLEGQKVGNLDLAIAAQVVQHRKGPSWLKRRLRDIFLMRKPEPNEIHKILALLRCRYYITTNYDLLFDSVLRDFLNCESLPVVINDEDIPNADPVTYIKLHGDIATPDTMVLTYDDYATRFEQNPNLIHLLYSLFAQNLVLFVGYSLGDSNVLSVVRKIRYDDPRYARGMYILVTNPDEEKADFFRSLHLKVINVDRRSNESESEALQRFLLRLWNRTLDFDIYLNPEPRQISYSSKLQIAISSYRRGDYHNAVPLFDELESTPKSIWSADPGIFAQYSYFKLKTLDKLNRWEEMGKTGGQLLTMLVEFSAFYPAPVVQSIRAQIHASIGLPLLRATLFERAQSHLSEALALDPDDSVIGKDAMLLHADRHTVLAAIDLNLFYFCGRNPKHLTDAEQYLAKAWRTFTLFDDPGGPDEAHFLGRYFGAAAFLLMAKIRTQGLAPGVEEAEQLCDFGRMSHREISPGKNRVAYGKLAGRYCEAIVNLVLGGEYQARNEPEQAETSFTCSIEILQGLLSGSDKAVQIRLSPLESCKFHRALELAWRGRASLANAEPAGHVAQHHKLFRKFRASEELQYMNKKVLADENWVFTPLN